MRVEGVSGSESGIRLEIGRRIPDGDAVRKDSEMSVAMSLEVQRWSRRRAEPDLGGREPLHEHHGTAAVGAGPQGRRVMWLGTVFNASRFTRRSEQAEAHR